ncbi:MAG: hypothetical protein RLZZ324_732 [Candidatus Parcubacteria bacterium]|jgi:hypothetical protein
MKESVPVPPSTFDWSWVEPFSTYLNHRFFGNPIALALVLALSFVAFLLAKRTMRSSGIEMPLRRWRTAHALLGAATATYVFVDIDRLTGPMMIGPLTFILISVVGYLKGSDALKTTEPKLEDDAEIIDADDAAPLKAVVVTAERRNETHGFSKPGA